MIVEPSWKRIGLSQPLDKRSGQGIGIIILDEITPHVSLRHLKGKIKRVKVHKDFSITCSDVLKEPLTKEVDKYTEHGLKLLSLLAHQPMKFKENMYSGLVQSAHFIFFYASQPERRKKGLEWILQQDWNVKICLNLSVPQERGWMSPTKEDLNVQALQPVLDAGLMVIAAGGNSKVHNNLHPKSFFVIGGFDDSGSSDQRSYKQHPSVSFGLNGDGHWRPDLLAPYTYLPLPSLTSGGLDYFGGT
ncbi:hypothetical protein [Hazenella coriacea]|uniref:Subtilase family protein n=1 Tax=Hazenella coriacea TaxID=1179467 RepID=A0A4R3L9I2_9BACL|nr:hypothetical protein [Hazenella coriacea]TCS95770.1 hypothetical protein EDD58_102351 [Hazenella coriacea]